MGRMVTAVLAAWIAALCGSAPVAAQGWCTPGARVSASSYGHWYAATVLGPDGAGKCTVHYDKFSSSSDEAVTRDRIGPLANAAQYDSPGTAPAARTAAAPARGAADTSRPVVARYTCTSFVGPVTGGGHLVPMPGLAILAGGRYSHANGGGGTFTVAGDIAEFHGGPLNGQAARFDAGADGRRGGLHILNERRTRGVIDCDGHA